MVLVDWLLDLWLSNVHGQFRLKTFVDDWQVQFHTAELMIPLWTAIQDFASMIDVDIDLGKTHAWSLEASARAQYRQGPVPVKLGARSLGAHQNFCRRFSNSTLLQRIRGMTKTWSALRACLSPYKLKAMALKILAWPRALHGVSVVAVGDQHFRDLRSGAMKGLRSNRIGANPMLHLCTQSLVSDPEVWSILQTIKDAREYPDRHLLEAFLGLFASAPAEMPRNGPVAALRGRLVRLGWEVHPNGIVSDRYGAFSILHAPWQEIVARLSVAWSGVLAQAVSHRPTFKGLDAADIQEVQDKVKTYGEADQAFIRCMLDGTLFTQRARAHFQAEIKGECVFCQQPDGFEHRMWNCPHFRDCRTHLTEQDHDTIAELPVCTRLHGWPLIPASVHSLHHHLIHLPEQPLTVVHAAGSPRYAVHDPEIHLFLDGTCRLPKDKHLRFAAWAVCQAGTGTSSLESVVVLGGHLTGLLQSAIRAELTAAVEAVQWAVQRKKRVRLWCDCLSVVRGIRKLLRRDAVRPNAPHSDLWKKLEAMMQEVTDGVISITKVVSHGAAAQADNALQQWAYWHNALVDNAAAGINMRRSGEFWTLWDNASRALQQQRHVEKGIWTTAIRIAWKVAQQKPSEAVKARRAAVEDSAISDPPLPVISEWAVNEKLRRRYGDVNINAVHAWWTQVGGPALQSSAGARNVAGFQLFLDFAATTGCEGPFVHKQKWYSAAHEAPTQAVKPWGSRVVVFLTLLRAYWKSNGFCVGGSVKRPDSCLVPFWVVCYRLPWPRERLEQLDRLVMERQGGQYTTPASLKTLAPVQFDGHRLQH